MDYLTTTTDKQLSLPLHSPTALAAQFNENTNRLDELRFNILDLPTVSVLQLVEHTIRDIKDDRGVAAAFGESHKKRQALIPISMRVLKERHELEENLWRFEELNVNSMTYANKLATVGKLMLDNPELVERLNRGHFEKVLDGKQDTAQVLLFMSADGNWAPSDCSIWARAFSQAGVGSNELEESEYNPFVMKMLAKQYKEVFDGEQLFGSVLVDALKAATAQQRGVEEKDQLWAEVFFRDAQDELEAELIENGIGDASDKTEVLGRMMKKAFKGGKYDKAKELYLLLVQSAKDVLHACEAKSSG